MAGNKMVGKQSVCLENAVHFIGSASIAGKKEGEGPLGRFFDRVSQDDTFGGKNWEAAESILQEETIKTALQKAGVSAEQIRYLLGGDLLGQLIATSFGVAGLQIPLFGLYGACSTCAEALSLGAMLIDGGYAEYIVAVTSSHFASAERQFRFPLAYGNQRPMSATWTVTGCGAFVLAGNGGKSCIKEMTTGKVVDYGVKDSMNMGACMAPAAADTIYRHFVDFERTPEEYDRIITGDLGSVGQKILIDLLKEKGFDISKVHMDCGMEIYDAKTQDTHAGGSGCGCSAATLAAKILPNLEKGKWKRVLFVPTGALHSTISFNEGNSVPGIAHGVVIEHC